MKLGRYNKFWVALIGGAVVFLANYFGEDSQAVDLVIALATALGVYSVPNEG